MIGKLFRKSVRQTPVDTDRMELDAQSIPVFDRIMDELDQLKNQVTAKESKNGQQGSNPVQKSFRRAT